MAKFSKLETRLPKEKDQEEVVKAFNLIKQLMENHSEIESTLWAGAFWSILVDGYSASGVSYDQFTKEFNQVRHHYRSWFDH